MYIPLHDFEAQNDCAFVKTARSITHFVMNAWVDGTAACSTNTAAC